jgi:hypothetical protein
MDDDLRQLLDKALDGIQYHMDGLAGGQLSVDDWQQGMSQDLLIYHTTAYMLGQETDELTPDEQRLLNRIVGEQVDYLNRFADVIDQADDFNEAWRSRAAMYVGALKTSYYRGAYADWDLPFQPGEDTDCYGNCLCSWTIADNGDGTATAEWVRNANDSCATCKEREAGNPYLVYEVGGSGDAE